MTMQNMRQEGRELMKRAEETMKAGQAEANLRRLMAEAKTEEDWEWVKRNASDCRGLYPAHAARFGEIMAEVDAVQKKAKKPRKDPRPRPDKPTRADYSTKAWELLPAVESDREVARQVIVWARERGEKDPTGFGRWRILGESCLQKIAGELRKDWAKERAKRKKT